MYHVLHPIRVYNQPRKIAKCYEPVQLKLKNLIRSIHCSMRRSHVIPQSSMFLQNENASLYKGHRITVLKCRNQGNPNPRRTHGVVEVLQPTSHFSLMQMALANDVGDTERKTSIWKPMSGLATPLPSPCSGPSNEMRNRTPGTGLSKLQEGVEPSNHRAPGS